MLKKVLKFCVPHGLVMMRNRAIEHQSRLAAESARTAYHAERHQRIAAVKHEANGTKSLTGSSYEEVIRFLVHRGLPEHHVREGSVPLASLEFIRDEVIARLDGDQPLKALHVGNFVGVSLTFFTAALVKCHPRSLVVSVDPNLTHRGIQNPQSHLLALLSACGLQSNSLILTGYSGTKSISNDATIFADYDPVKEFANEFAAEQTICNLGQICPGAFDLIFLDGNHEASYLVNEIKQVLPLLRPTGYLVLDDVAAAWSEILNVFRRLSDFGLEPLSTDGRVGVARRGPPTRINSL